MIVKHRRGTTEEWLENAIIPEAGELVIEECEDGTRRCKIGTGYQYFSDLPYIDDKLWEEIAKTKEDLSGKIARIDDRFSKELEKYVQSLETKIATEKDICEKAIANLTAVALNSDNQLRKESQEADAVLLSKIEATSTDLTTRMDTLSNTTAGGINSLNSQLTNIKSDIKGQLYNQTEQFTKLLDKSAAEVTAAYTSKIAALAEDLEATSKQLEDLNTKTEDNKISIVDSYRTANNQIKALKTDIGVQAKRIDSIIAPEEGEPVTDAQLIKELQDIRIGHDEIRHSSAGAAVRSIGTEVRELRDSLSQYIGTEAINGLYYDIEGNVGLGQPYMLYLKTADGDVIQDSGVQVVGGAGGGGGGGSSASSTLKISYITKDAIKITSPEQATLNFVFTGTDSAGDTLSQASAQWKVNGTTVTRGTVKDGENSFDASAYVRENDTIKVLLIVTDDNGSVATKTWSIQHIALKIASDFNDRKTWPVGEPIPFSYKVEGALKKTAVFKLNGKEIGRQTLEANVSGFDRGDISYEIPAYDENGKLREHDSYLLEVYLEANLDGDTIRSKSTVIKDLLWCDESKLDALPLIGAAPQSFNTKQYSAAEIVFTVYDPNTDTPKVNIEVDGVVVSSPTIEPNPKYDYTTTDSYSYVTDQVGTHVVKIICGKTEKVITVVVESLNINISPVTTGLVFDFHPVGVSNNDIDKRLWSQGDIHMRVSENFDWKNGGYQIEKDEDGNSIPGTEHFCIKAGSTATIDYKLFANDAKSYGKECKLVFKTRHVTNPEAVFLSCIDNKTAQDHIGLQMEVHKANIFGQSGKLDLAYSEEDIIEFEFNISKSTEAVPMVMGYEDGVPSRPMVYDSTYNFKQNTPKEITLGSPDCDLLIYRFKVYNTSLTASAILDNFIADARTSEEMISRYNRNQIYNENNKLDPDVLAEKCPWLRVYKLSAPHFTNNKSDKVANTTIQQLYKAGDPVLDNWVCYNAQHSGQGTSSNNYGAAGRNLDFIMNKDGSYFELGDGSMASTITLTRESVPVAYLNAKVNIASSNNLTNAILANRYNRFNPYRRPFVERDSINSDFIKDTMEFHNCVIFIQETDPDPSTHREFADTDWHFYAIGNIGDSKKTDNTRATDPDDKYECCVEIMDVGLPLSDFPSDTMMNAMGYSLDETDETIKHYTWAKDENLGILYERRFTKTTDEVVDLSKTYYVEIDGKMTLAKSHYVEIIEYLWATDENLGILYEKVGDTYELTQDTTVDYDKTYYIKDETPDEQGNVTVKYVDAMGYTIREEKTNDWVTNENIANLYELEYFLTEDATVNYNKTYYVDILEHDDFSEDYTYGWRYLWEDGTDEENEEVFNYCKQKWIELYRFITTSTDEEFKANLKNYFVIDSALYYYLFTTRYCMVDNRAKNTFWHYGKAADGSYKWDLCWDYDNDTSLGLNNYGKQVYRYGFEDTDRDEANIEIFRESDSTFFCRIRDLFASELKAMYNTLESKDAWHAESLIRECDTWQEEFPEELWRLDINRKYIRTYNSSFINGGGDKQFLVNMCNGKMKYHRRQWERNQESYMASKYQTNRALGDNYHVNFRVNRFESTDGMAVAPNYQFTLTPYSYVYLNVQYGGTRPVSVRAVPNVPTTVPFAGALSADIINIGSAAAIRDFGDLSAIYPHTASVQNATRVKTLTLGSNVEGYSNDNFTSLTTGDNALLEELNLTNITSYTGSLSLEKLLNLRKFYAFGTNLSGITFADGGKLDYVELPAVNNISLKNLIYLNSDNFKVNPDEAGINNYDSVVDLTIENCPLINTVDLFNKCKSLNRVRLVGVDFGTVDYEDFTAKVFDLDGISASGDSTENAVLIGKAKFGQLDGAQFSELKTRYPDLDISYDTLESTVVFKGTDLETTVHTGKALNAADYTDPVYYGDGEVPAGKIAKPVKASTDEFDYEFIGWSLNKNIIVLAENLTEELINNYKEALKHIEGNKTFYPVFKAIRRNYDITFVNPTAPEGKQVICVLSTPYGSDADYYAAGYQTPTKQDAISPDSYEFVGWYPSPEKITGALTCYAQFTIKDMNRLPGGEDDGDTLPGYTIGQLDITGCTDYYGEPLNGTGIGYSLNTDGTMSIFACNNKFNSIIRIPDTLELEGTSYKVTSLTGFNGFDKLELVMLPETLVELGMLAFGSCTNLAEIMLPESLQRINKQALQKCTKLHEIRIPAGVESIEEEALRECINLENIIVADGNTRFKVIQNCLIDSTNKKLLQGLATGVIPQDGSVTSLGSACFDSMPITSIEIPNSITKIPSNAFSHCEQLAEVKLPSTLEELGATCFGWCHNLSKIDLPEGLKSIFTYVFYECSLEEITLPSTITNIYSHAFCDTNKLNSVTFTNKPGSALPSIHYGSFYNAGSADFSINVPWSLQQHIDEFAGTYVDIDEKQYVKDIFFGAKIGSKIVFADGTTIVKEQAIEDGNRFKGAN